MTINCKNPGCPGFVVYKPGAETELFAFTTELKENLFDNLDSEKFEQSVKNIVKADTNNFHTIKTIYLTCDMIPSHTYGYSIPS